MLQRGITILSGVEQKGDNPMLKHQCHTKKVFMHHMKNVNKMFWRNYSWKETMHTCFDDFSTIRYICRQLFREMAFFAYAEYVKLWSWNEVFISEIDFINRILQKISFHITHCWKSLSLQFEHLRKTHTKIFKRKPTTIYIMGSQYQSTCGSFYQMVKE